MNSTNPYALLALTAIFLFVVLKLTYGASWGSLLPLGVIVIWLIIASITWHLTRYHK